MNIYIVTSSDIEYDDNYYDLNPYATAGHIDFVDIDLDRAIAYAKKSIDGLYTEFEDNLEDIEWGQYININKTEDDLSNENKLQMLRELAHLTIKIHIFKCELNNVNEALFVLNKRLMIDVKTGETKEIEKRKWY